MTKTTLIAAILSFGLAGMASAECSWGNHTTSLPTEEKVAETKIPTVPPVEPVVEILGPSIADS